MKGVGCAGAAVPTVSPMEDAMRWLHLASTEAAREPLTSISEEGHISTSAVVHSADQLLTGLATEDASASNSADANSAEQYIQYTGAVQRQWDQQDQPRDDWVDQDQHFESSMASADNVAAGLSEEQHHNQLYNPEQEYDQAQDTDQEQERDQQDQDQDQDQDQEESGGPLEVTHLWSLTSEIPGQASVFQIGL